jgi:cytoskeletal protein RodZ
MTTLGEALLRERQKSNIGLAEISQKTNISVKALAAIENNQYKKIPGVFYLKNYIKSYLNAVGSDEAAFIATNREAIDAVLSDIGGKSNAFYSRLTYSRFKDRDFILLISYSTAIFILTVSLLYISKGNIHREKPNKPTPVGITEIKPVLPPVFEDRGYSIDYQPVQVDIQFLDKCWMQVFRGNKKIIEQVFHNGDNTTVEGYRLHFSIGNPSAVKFYIDNREVSYLKTLLRAEQLTVDPSTIDGILKK